MFYLYRSGSLIQKCISKQVTVVCIYFLTHNEFVVLYGDDSFNAYNGVTFAFENGFESVEMHQGLSNLDKSIDILIDGSNPLSVDR